MKGDAAAASSNVDDLKAHTARAREATTDPLWTLAGGLPWIGDNFQASTVIATSADDVVTLGAVPLVSVLDEVDWKSYKPSGDGLQLQPIAEAAPKLKSAAHAVSQSADRLNGISANNLMPQIAGPLVKAREQLTSLRDGLQSTADAALILPKIMGHETPRSYLLLVQNNAESRATGGIPGALAVLNVKNGQMTLGTQSSASALGAFNPVIKVDSEQQSIYSSRLGKFMQDINLTPDFPTAAQTAKSMWEARTGQKVDGVLSIDPVALADVLKATGEIRLTDPILQDVAGGRLPTTLSSENLVPTLLSDVYAKIPEPNLQDEYFAGVAKEVFSKFSSGTGNTKTLLEGLFRGAGERRIQFWSTDVAEQSIVARYPLGGSVVGTGISPAQFGVYFNDGTGAKMDYYVKRTVQIMEECGINGYSQVRVRVTSTNTAPKDAASTLPKYVTGGGTYGVPEGSVQTNLTAYGPVQSNVEAVFVSDKKVGFASHRHANRPVGAVTIRLAPGQSSTVDFTFGKIVQHADPVLAVTPTVQAEQDVVLATRKAECTTVP
ncbi:DUF4012 domain-containing protein [Arthrobacter globiformis]|uniref:DUF4012 domain-containing protein n=1 Tax=Arthrobacter globiformis TaxID=1665 RepID=UPI003979D474